MDEVAAAPVDERAVGMASQSKERCIRRFASASQGFRLESGIIVNRNTSVYININQVIPRLGMNIELHEPPFGRDAPELASHGPNSFP
jgi:hypothetical protein